MFTYIKILINVDGKEKPTIRSAIEKIRFLTLTPQQFAEGPARSSLLTESEAFAVLMNILSSNSDVPMPRGFSTCRVPRKQLIGGGPSCNVSMMLVLLIWVCWCSIDKFVYSFNSFITYLAFALDFVRKIKKKLSSLCFSRLWSISMLN